MNARELYDVLTPFEKDLRQTIFQALDDPLFKHTTDTDLYRFRELTLKRIHRFLHGKFASIRDYTNNPLKYMAALECAAFVDYSMAIKMNVHMTLCGGTICKLGTEKHFAKYLDKIDTLDYPGSYCMTELGHGSNVMGIETTATFDRNRRTFTINTPSNTASKIWIGGIGQHAKISVVFAQLIVNGKYEGPHAFIVHVRDDNMKPTTGVKIRDMGSKMGLQGIDNGQVWFDHVEIPYDGLLDRYCRIDEQGVYHNVLPNIAERFSATIAGLTLGRVLITQGSIDSMKQSLNIAVRYSLKRPQFGDALIMDYTSHQKRLIPGIAQVFGLQLALNELKGVMSGATGVANAKDVHVVSSALKALASWQSVDCMQQCRECCGGMGFLSENKIPDLIKDGNIAVTFEGDNTVLMQQVAKLLTRLWQKCKENDKCDFLKLQHMRIDVLVESVKDGGNGHIDRMVELGNAYGEYLCLNAYLAAIDKIPHPRRQLVRLLYELYGNSVIFNNLGFFLSYGIIGGKQNWYGDLQATIAQLCKALGEHETLLTLCDGFGIPPHLVSAPIAFDWKLLGTTDGRLSKL